MDKGKQPDKGLGLAARQRVKCISILFVLLASGLNTAQSQSLGISVFAEQNIMGFQKGIEIGYVACNNLQISYFFQATKRIDFEGDDSNYPFHGLSFTAPIRQSEDLIFSAGVKTGFVNGKYLIMTPLIVTELKLFGPLSLGFTAAYRAGHPALGSKLSVKI